MYKKEPNTMYTCFPRWVRFALSGVATAGVQLAVLYVLADMIKVHYLVAATVAFVVAIVTNFILQKQWTFEDGGQDGVFAKFAAFFTISVLNLVLNIVGMCLLVTVAGLWHMFAQCIMMGVLAVMNYFLYKTFVFRSAPAVPCL